MKAIDTALRHVGARLKASTALVAAVDGRIHEGIVPEESPYPVVLVQVYGSPDTIVYNGGSIAHYVLDLHVRVVDTGDTMGPLIPIARHVHEALHDTQGVYSSGIVTSCHETGESTFTEREGGRTYRYLGARYRLTVA